MDLITLEIDGFDQLQREHPETLDLEWVDFFARLDGPVRLLSLPAPFDLGPALEQIQAQLGPLEARERALAPLAEALDTWEAGTTPERLTGLLADLPPILRDELAELLGDRERGDKATWAPALDALAQPLWRIGPLRSYRQELRGYAAHNLRGLRHFLLAWLPPGARPAHLIRAVEDTFDTHARETALPSIQPGTYTDQPDVLQPDDPRHPYVAFLTAYDRQGRWSPDILHRALAREIQLRLVRGPYRAMFQGATTIEWQLDRFDVLCYDFSQVPAGYLQTIYYDAAFGALLRHLYDPQRDRRRPVLGIIDEYGIMARVPGMRAFVASYMKHARNYNGHLWLFDQDYHRIDAGDDDSQSIVTNSPIRFFMRQESKNARRIAETIDGIRPHHVHAIQRARVGECVLSWKPDGSGGRAHEVVIGRVVPTAEEWSYFGTGRM